MAFATPVVEHWLEREIAQWVHRQPISLWANGLTMEVHLTPPQNQKFHNEIKLVEIPFTSVWDTWSQYGAAVAVSWK